MAREARKKVEPALTLHVRERSVVPQEPLVADHESIADLLRHTREQYGEDLPSVADALRIRFVHLKAIEEGRFRDLPGTTYAIGFVRSYAEFLGLDGVEIVERFKEEVEGLSRKPQLVFPTPVPEGKVPGGALILISVVLLAVAYGAWTYLSRPGGTVADLIPPVPEHLQSLTGERQQVSDREAASSGRPASEGESAATSGTDAPAPAVMGAPEAQENETGATGQPSGETESAVTAADDSGTAEAAGDPVGDGTASETSSTAGADFSQELLNGPNAAQAASSEGSEGEASEPEAAAVSEATEGGDSAASEPLSSGEEPPAAESFEEALEEEIPAAPQLALRSSTYEAQVYGADNEDARIVLRARHDSWVQVRDAEDSLLLTRVLREGDSYRVPNREGLTLLTGNAGGIEILVDGRRLAPLGPLGAVRRDIVLDPEALAQGRTAAE